MFNFLFGSKDKQSITTSTNVKNHIHTELVEKWRKFFSLIGIELIPSDKDMYDLMSKEAKYSSKKHLYIKVHSSCPWKGNIGNVQRIDNDTFCIVLQVCETLNAYPPEETDRSILLGISIERRYQQPIFLHQCRECMRCTFHINGEWGCEHGFPLDGYHPKVYKDILSAASIAGIPIQEKNMLDAYHLEYTPSIDIQDGEDIATDIYIYLISKVEKRNGVDIIVCKVGTISSPSSLSWNISEMFQDVRVELLLYSKNASGIAKAVNNYYCANNGWILGRSPKFIIKGIMLYV